MRSIKEIAYDINIDWKNVYFGAVPYLKAMAELETMEDNFGWDSAESVIRYFLSNATTWRGEKAREIEAELKEMLKS